MHCIDGAPRDRQIALSEEPQHMANDGESEAYTQKELVQSFLGRPLVEIQAVHYLIEQLFFPQRKLPDLVKPPRGGRRRMNEVRHEGVYTLHCLFF